MDHIAHLFAWAIERGETAAAVLALPFYHPTFEDGLKPALRQICQAVHAPELEHLDDVAPPGPDRDSMTGQRAPVANVDTNLRQKFHLRI